MNNNAPLTGIVTEKYQTGKGKHGLIIDCDNPAFKYPVKGYDGTFGATLGLNVFKVGDKVELRKLILVINLLNVLLKVDMVHNKIQVSIMELIEKIELM